MEGSGRRGGRPNSRQVLIIVLIFKILIFCLHRVKAAIGKKEEAICELQRNYDHAMADCQHLETLLQRQTKQTYLGSKTTVLSNKGRK